MLIMQIPSKQATIQFYLMSLSMGESNIDLEDLKVF